MTYGIILLIIIYILWLLLVKGLLWKIIIGIFGWFGMYWFLGTFESLQTCPLNIAGYTFSWASIVPTIVLLLGIAYTKE